jgi:hypothetical protein
VTTQQIIELVAAAVLIALGVLQYRRRSAEGGQYGSQSAVLLFVAAALVLVHALGLLEYRPSPSELGQ